MRFFKRKFVIFITVVITISAFAAVYYINQGSKPEESGAATTYTYVRQTVDSLDGRTRWFRDCLYGSSGNLFSQCTKWSDPITLSSLGVGNGSFGAYSAFTYSKNGQTTLKQSVYSKDGLSGWSRDCPYYTWGLESGDCTGWSGGGNNLTNLRGVGNESYGSFTSFIYSTSNATKLRQSVYSLDGKSGWFRECNVDSQGPNFNQCDATWTGSVNNLTNVRGTGGNEAYGSNSSIIYFQGGQQWIRQVLVTLDGSAAYARTCAVDPLNGLTFTNCSGGWQEIGLSNIRGVGGERYGNYEEVTYAAQINLLPQMPQYSSRSGPLKFGVAVGSISANQFNDPGYSAALKKYGYRIIVPENEMKMKYTQPSQGSFDFSAMDQIVSFAQANGMEVQGLPLVWHRQLPTWLTNGSFTRTQLITIMKNHIQTTMARYKGTVHTWEVVNEAIEDDGTMRRNIWYNIIGPDYIDLAFRFAYEADPSAKLMYNDYFAEGMAGKSNAVYNLVSGLRNRNVPIAIVGLQSHFALGSYVPTSQEVASNISRLGSLGLEVNFTEIDVSIKAYPGSATQLSQQADVYRSMAQVCHNAPNCKEYVSWGVTDKYSFLYLDSGGNDAPLLLDANYQPKPAYWAITQFMGINLTPSPVITPPPPPTGLTASCPAPGNRATVSWNSAPGATSYALRIDNRSNGFDGNCNALPGDFCGNVTSTSYTHTTTPGQTYIWWVHSFNSAGGSAESSAGFTCATPTNTPTPTATKTNTPTPTKTNTPTPTATRTNTPTPTPTRTGTPIPSQSVTATKTPTTSPTVSASLTATKTPTSTATGLPSATNTQVAVKPGDANGDGKVDGIDYTVWLFHYDPTRTQSGGRTIGDFDTNGIVDGIDFVIWLNNYNS